MEKQNRGEVTNEIRWGIIGAGDVCEIKSGPAFQQVQGSSLVAVMRRNAQAAADFAKRHKVPKWYEKADDLINDPEVNAIYIATPPNSHAEYTLMAAAAGKPVYVEKPMARTFAECQAMVAACSKADVPLFVAYYRRALPNILKVKELIEAGEIGEIRFVQINIQMPMHPDIVGASKDLENWRTNPEIAGGGYFYDLASHQLDAMDFLFGAIVKANGFKANQSKLYKADDIRIGAFEFENGMLGSGIWSFNTGHASQDEMTTIVGSKGQIAFPFFGDHHVTIKKDNEPEKRFDFEISQHIQMPLIQTIVDALRGKGSCPSTGASGSRTNWVLEQIGK